MIIFICFEKLLYAIEVCLSTKQLPKSEYNGKKTLDVMLIYISQRQRTFASEHTSSCTVFFSSVKIVEDIHART